MGKMGLTAKYKKKVSNIWIITNLGIYNKYILKHYLNI